MREREEKKTKFFAPKTKAKGRKRIHDVLESSKVRVKKLGIDNDSLFQFFKPYNQGNLF